MALSERHVLKTVLELCLLGLWSVSRNLSAVACYTQVLPKPPEKHFATQPGRVQIRGRCVNIRDAE